MYCRTPATLKTTYKTYISYGSLGGITGSYTEVRILPDGSVFKKVNFNRDFYRQKTIEIKLTKQIFSLIRQIDKGLININDPGNRTYFIKYVENNKDRVELIWGGGNQNIDAKFEILYRTLMNLSIDDHPVR